jgi:hypothetical protein
VRSDGHYYFVLLSRILPQQIAEEQSRPNAYGSPPNRIAQLFLITLNAPFRSGIAYLISPNVFIPLVRAAAITSSS